MTPLPRFGSSRTLWPLLLGLLAACAGSSTGNLQVVALSPGDGATGVATYAPVTLTLSSPLDAASLPTTTFALVPRTPGTLQVSGPSLVFTPAAPLLAGVRYTATVQGRLTDAAGVGLGVPVRWSFTTAPVFADAAPPARVTDLAATAGAGSVTLRWTAPADDGSTGRAAAYDLRALSGSACPITAANFLSSAKVPTAAPQQAGKAETASATGLAAHAGYCFALVSRDPAGNASSLSNVVSATTLDTIAPATVVDLSAIAASDTSIHLGWTAPGDDGSAGTAAAYDLRSASGSGCPITAANFSSATKVADVPAPKAALSPEGFDVTGLTAKTAWCFALRAADAAGNAGGVSNPASATTLDATPPAAIANLAAAATSESVVHLTWTATGDDGAAGTAAAYDLRRASGGACPLTAATFFSAERLPAAAAPKAAGAAESLDAGGHARKTSYCYAIQAIDAAGNRSPASNSAAATTPDATPPAAVTNLAATALGETSARLAWSAPGDDGAVGTAAAYDLRYASGAACPITASSFATATAATGEPAPKAAGGAESFDVTGLARKTTWCFALTARDAAGNVSALSTVATVTLPDQTPPAAVSTLAATMGNTSATLTWTEVADDGATGTAAARADAYAAATCPASVAGLTPVASKVGLAAPGATETLSVTGLAAATAYCFVVVVSDAAGNRSGLSNGFSGTTTSEYTLGGSISGLSGTVVLRDGLGGEVSISSPASSFTFPARITTGNTWEVTVKTQPAGQLCTVSGGGPTAMGTADVTTVSVTCVTGFALGGSATGVAGGSLVLTLQPQGGAAEDLTLGADGAYAFATHLPTGATWAVTVKTAPAGKSCAVANTGGTISADVTDINVTCAYSKVWLVRLGDGAAALSNASAATFIDEYDLTAATTSTAFVRTVAALDSTSSTTSFTNAGTSTSEAFLQRSGDGRYLTFAGYRRDKGVASISGTSAAISPRVVGRIDAAGNLDVSTVLTGAFSGSNVRSAYTLDGSAYWVAGTAATAATGGIQYIAHGGTTPVQVVNPPTNIRVASVYQGALYFTSGSSPYVGLNAVAGLAPTSATSTAALLPGFTSTSPYGFAFLGPAGGAPDTVYLSQDVSSQAALLERWKLSSGTWAKDASFTPTLSGLTGGSRALAMTPNGTGQRIAAVAGNGSLVTFDIDAAGAVVASTIKLVASPATNTIFRGVAYPPTP